LFEAVLEHIEQHKSVTRDTVIGHFKRDDDRVVVGVLTDLVQSGLVYCSGSGDGTLYGVTSDAERQRLTRHADISALANMALGEIYRNPGVSFEALAHRLQVQSEQLKPAIEQLIADGRVAKDERTGTLRASTFQISAGAAMGWESAVFDHFQAMAAAIVNKLRLRAKRSIAADFVGGTTLRFELSAQHPLQGEVLELLARVRALTQDVWERTAEHNDHHPLDAEERFNVSFYFGQNIDNPGQLDPGWSEE
jgi:predicted GIY-YIG superfamily endonuclease